MLNPQSSVLDNLGLVGIAIDEDKDWLAKEIANVARNQDDPEAALQQIAHMMGAMSQLRNFQCELDRFGKAYQATIPFSQLDIFAHGQAELDRRETQSENLRPSLSDQTEQAAQARAQSAREVQLARLAAQYTPKISPTQRQPDTTVIKELNELADLALEENQKNPELGPGDPRPSFREGADQFAAGRRIEEAPGGGSDDDRGPQGHAGDAVAGQLAQSDEVAADAVHVPPVPGEETEGAVSQDGVPNPVISKNKTLTELPRYQDGTPKRTMSRQLKPADYTTHHQMLPSALAVMLKCPEGQHSQAFFRALEAELKAHGILDEKAKPADFEILKLGSARMPRWKCQMEHVRKALKKQQYMVDRTSFYQLTEKGLAWVQKEGVARRE